MCRTRFYIRSLLRTRYSLCSPAVSQRSLASDSTQTSAAPFVEIDGATHTTDGCTNVRPSLLRHLGRNLHRDRDHPLELIKRRVTSYMYRSYVNSRGNPLFSLHDNLSPVVSVGQNFDGLLVPHDHPSRSCSDNYYINAHTVLRSHTSAHQADLIRAGLNAFLVVGDVYRRDEIDRTHYPVFHQMEAVRLRTREQLFGNTAPDSGSSAQIFENGCRTDEKQEWHSAEAVKLMEGELKQCLEGLARDLFGDARYRWTSCYFPFTHPSWELEVELDGRWLEVLGCGIMQQQILLNNGAGDRIGWAFGLGLERLAMKLYSIPDIRLFWSRDSGFLSQFCGLQPDAEYTYKPVSVHPHCTNDLSFWLPASGYSSADLYDLVRSLGGDLVEQVKLVDEFSHPKSGRRSHCYRIMYRHMERTLTQPEVNDLHQLISSSAAAQLHVEIR